MEGFVAGLLAFLLLPLLVVAWLLSWFWRLSGSGGAADVAATPRLPRWPALLALATTASLAFYFWLTTVTYPWGSPHGPSPGAERLAQHPYVTLCWVLLLGAGFALLLARAPARRPAAAAFLSGLVLALGGAGSWQYLSQRHEKQVRQAQRAADEREWLARKPALQKSFYGRKYSGTALDAYDVDQRPAFPGGELALAQAIRQRTRYPATAAEDQLDGAVVIEFIVEADGRLTFAHVYEGGGIGTGCDEEALRVVKSLPPFVPGRKSRRPVAVISYASVPFQRFGPHRTPPLIPLKHQRPGRLR